MRSAAVERALAAVRPHPHRGDLIAAAAVPLALGVLMTEVRFDGVWGRGVLFVLALLATALVLGMGLLAPLEEPRPRAYQTVLLVAGLALLALTIVRLAQVLGEDSPFAASGTVTWMTTLFAAVAAVAAWHRRSPICALIEFVAGGIALLAFVQWVFDPQGPNTSRWLLLVLILVYAAAHVRLRDHWPRHAVHAVNAAGVAAIVLGCLLSRRHLGSGAARGRRACRHRMGAGAARRRPGAGRLRGGRPRARRRGTSDSSCSSCSWCSPGHRARVPPR